MREMDLWLCLVLSINGSRKGIFRHCPLDIPVTIGDAGEDEAKIFGCILGVLASPHPRAFSLSGSYLPNATVWCTWPCLHCDVRLRNVSGVVSLLESWAEEVCHRGLMESALSICLLPIMNVSVSQGVWNSTALRQICSAVHHAPSSSADIVDLSLAAPSQNVSERDLRSLPATWARRKKKDEICPSLSATLRAEGQVEVTLTVTIVKHSLMHLHPAACESLQRMLLSHCYNVIYYF